MITILYLTHFKQRWTNLRICYQVLRGKKNKSIFQLLFHNISKWKRKVQAHIPNTLTLLAKATHDKSQWLHAEFKEPSGQQVTHQVVHKGAWSPPVFFFQILLSQYYYRGIYYAYIKYFQWSDKILMSILCYVNKNCVIFLFTGHTSRLLNRKFNVVWYK